MGLPEKPSAVTLSELRPDVSTGRYTATKPGDAGKKVDVKAELSSIRADRLEENEKSAAARKIIADNAADIAHMRDSTYAARQYYARKNLKYQKYLQRYKNN
jgi:hypothetical protein